MALKIEKKEKRTMGEIDFENVGFGTQNQYADGDETLPAEWF